MTQPTVEQLVQLLQYCESFAKQMLINSAEFYPFGAFINAHGKIEALGAYDGQEHPNSQDVYRLLNDSVVQMAREGKIIAYGLAANVNIPSQFESPHVDGIRVHVEAPEYSRHIYTPYRVLPYRALRRFLAFLPVVEYAEPITVDLEPAVFQSAG
jgi:hypothetical protein